MISPHFRSTLAQARFDELSRTARAAGRSRRHAQAVPPQENVTLRGGLPEDAKRLERLAALDSASPLTPPLLLAEVDGKLLAALALSDGSVVADPFHRTADVIELLRARARQLDGNTDMAPRGRLRGRSRLSAPAWR